MNKTIFQDMLEELRATNRFLDAILTELEKESKWRSSQASDETPFPKATSQSPAGVTRSKTEVTPETPSPARQVNPRKRKSAQR